jgi:transcriptional regulator GlxA family with amidase domain
MEVAIPLYEGITALDAIGPYEVLSRLPGTEVRFVGVASGPKRTDMRALALVADLTLDEVPSPDVLVVPGGGDGGRNPGGEELVGWIRAAHESSRWTTSVCTGSPLLGQAGVLEGLSATSHWLYLDRLREHGADPTSERVVRQGKVITAAGVSSGIDMALRLVQLEAGDAVAQAIQLGLEYDPQPPFDAGSPDKASDQVVELVRWRAGSQ